jgi:RND family efflux transporter MFP subunit
VKYLLTRVILPALILLLGAFGFAVQVMLGPTTAPSSGERQPLAVEVLTLSATAQHATVTGTGVVEADQAVSLMPEVSGRIVWLADNLRSGKRIDAGQALARIDARDYRAALLAEQARLKQAQVELALEQERQSHSQRQWELLGDGRDSTQAELALRKPQLALAEANVASAQASVERAERNVRRTNLTVPFNAIVLDESLDLGQTVGGSPVATLAGSDRFRVPVSLPVDQLGMLEIPSYNAEQGGLARITQQLPSTPAARTGRVLGLQGQLDARTRTAIVLVGIDNPLQPEGDAPPLLPGAFVDVKLTGRSMEGRFALPRQALAEGDQVWLVRDGKLARQAVEVVFQAAEVVFVDGGLAAGDQVVTSRVSLPIEGQAVAITSPSAELGANAVEGDQ